MAFWYPGATRRLQSLNKSEDRRILQLACSTHGFCFGIRVAVGAGFCMSLVKLLDLRHPRIRCGHANSRASLGDGQYRQRGTHAATAVRKEKLQTKATQFLVGVLMCSFSGSQHRFDAGHCCKTSGADSLQVSHSFPCSTPDKASKKGSSPTAAFVMRRMSYTPALIRHNKTQQIALHPNRYV